MKPKVLAVASLFVLLLNPVALSWAKSSEAPKTIKIGVDVPLTGAFASNGVDVEFGYRIAAQHINAAGGVFVQEFNKKIPLELIIMDDSSDPVKVVSNLELLNSRDRVVSYLGGFSSGLHAAGAATAEKNKIPYLGSFFGLFSIHQKGYTYLFSPHIKSPDTAKATFELLDGIPKGVRPKKVAIFEMQDDWGKELTSYWRKEASSHGCDVVMVGPYAFGNKDFSSLLLQAKNVGAEIFLDVGTPPTVMTILQQAKQLNVNLKFHYTVRAGNDERWYKNLGSDTEGLCNAGTSWFHTLPFPKVAEINKTWNEKYPGEPTDMSIGSAYALVEILAEAIRRAGTLDRAKIKDALRTTEFTTCIGKVKFNPDGSCQNECVGIAQWQGSQVELVYPFKFATKPLLYPIPTWQERRGR